MKRLAEYKTVTYQYDEGIFVDIVTEPLRDGRMVYTAYLYRECGRKQSMFGRMADSISKAAFVKEIEADVPEYLEYYDRTEEWLDEMPEDYYDDLDDDDCEDCDSCPYCGGDCDHEEDDDIEYAEDGTPIATIRMAKLEGPDDDIKKANEIRSSYLDWLHDNFKTENGYSLLLFARWAAQRFTMASFWISIEDYQTEMMHTAIMMHVWMTETKEKGDAA